MFLYKNEVILVIRISIFQVPAAVMCDDLLCVFELVKKKKRKSNEGIPVWMKISHSHRFC